MLDILISSTRQSNPGDEFIMHGVQNILHQIEEEYNFIIYNRNLELIYYRKSQIFFKHPISWFLTKFIFAKKELIQLDNSFNSKFLKEEYRVDFVFIAGSPSWSNSELIELYSYVKKFNIPLIMLGIGGKSRFRRSSKLIKNTIKNAKLITTRDTQAINLLHQYGINNTKLLPCPALFSAPLETTRVVKKVKTIGLIYGHYKAARFNKISKGTYEYMMTLYHQLIKHYEGKYKFKLIAHYIDEKVLFKNDLPLDLHYSYDSRDYHKIYGECDVVIGHRVHGIGICASMGIPGIAIKHCSRSETVIGFKADLIDVGQDISNVMSIINGVIENIQEKSSIILEHKEKTLREYLDLLKPLIKQSSK